MGLQEKLNAYKRGTVKKAPKEALEIMHRATEDLRNSSIMEGIINVGDRAPEFELQDATEKRIQLRNLLSEGPLVLSFYRGKW